MRSLKFTVILLIYVLCHEMTMGLSIFSASERPEKRSHVCISSYMDDVQKEENLVDCEHGTYIDRCGNLRCHKTYGQKCGHFPGASHSLRLIYGKCDHCFYCAHDGTCHGIHNTSSRKCHHTSSSNQHHNRKHLLKRDPEMKFKYFYPVTNIVESDINRNYKDIVSEDDDVVIYPFDEGRVLDKNWSETGEKSHGSMNENLIYNDD